MQSSRAAPGKLQRASSNGRAAVFQAADAGSIPAARSRAEIPGSPPDCGGSSTVECERAKLATGVRFSSTAPGPRGPCHEPDLWRGTRSAKPRCRVQSPAGSPTPSTRRTGCRLLNGKRGFDSRRGPSISIVSSESSRPHLLDGSGSRTLTPATRVRIPLGTPGRSARQRATSGARARAGEPTNLPVLAARHRATNSVGEVRLLAGRPAPLIWRSRRERPKLALRVRLPAGALLKGPRPARAGRGPVCREERFQGRLIPSPRRVRLPPLLPRRLEDERRLS